MSEGNNTTDDDKEYEEEDDETDDDAPADDDNIDENCVVDVFRKAYGTGSFVRCQQRQY